MFGEKSVIGTHLVFEKILRNLPSEIALSLTKFPKHSKVEVRFFLNFVSPFFYYNFTLLLSILVAASGSNDITR